MSDGGSAARSPAFASADSQVRIEHDGPVATIVVDHPPINLMTLGVFARLAAAVDEVANDEAVRAVVLRSALPGWFVAHFDVAAILGFPTDAPRAPATELNAFHRMVEALRTMPKVTIAAIDGRVGGGGSELALGCDIRYATPGSVFNQPEVALGIVPGGSGTVRLARLLGRSRALEVILGGDDIDAATAERWGWINRVVPVHRIGDEVDRLAHRIARFPPAAVAAAKAAVLRAETAVVEDLLAEGDAFAALLGEAPTRSAMERFLALGGQTVDGETRLGELLGEI